MPSQWVTQHATSLTQRANEVVERFDLTDEQPYESVAEAKRFLADLRLGKKE